MAFGTGRERSRTSKGRGGEGGTTSVDFQEPTLPNTDASETVVIDETPIETPIENTEGQTIDVGPVTTGETMTVTEFTEDTATVEPTQDITGTVLDASATEPEAPAKGTDGRKRAPRPAINVGNVVVRPSTRTDFTTRATPTDQSPVFLAVKNAPLDTPTDILVENDDNKIGGAVSLLRRSGAKLHVGMHIAPKPFPVEEIDGVRYAVLTFKTSAERQLRGKQSKTEDETNAETPVAADAS